jgi:hypothetical protein
MVTVEKRGGVNGEESATFYGLSEDTKPTLANSGTEIPNGSAFLEIDTRQVYFYNPDNDEWLSKQD